MMSAAFKALLEDLRAVLGAAAAAAFMESPGAGLSALSLGPDYQRDAKSIDAARTAFFVKKTAFEAAIDPSAVCWFVFVEAPYAERPSPYRATPQELASIWDEPVLLAPALKRQAAVRDLTSVDPYSLDETVRRQWVMRVAPSTVDVEHLLRASARFYYAPSADPGPRLRASLFCFQPGVPVLYVDFSIRGACALAAPEPERLHPFIRPLRAWLVDRETRAAAYEQQPEAPPLVLPDPHPDVEWALWYEDLFDRDTPRSVTERGRGLLAGLTALWARYLIQGSRGLARFNLYGALGSIEIDGAAEGAQMLRGWIYGDRPSHQKGTRPKADVRLLEKVACVHAWRVGTDTPSASLLTLVLESPDRFVFERRLDELIQQGASEASRPS